MKRSYILSVIVVVIATAFLSSTALAGARHPKNAGDFRKSAAYKKLDLRLAQAWEESDSKGGDQNRALECIIKLSKRPTEEQRAMLSSAGFSYRTVVGDIVTGNVKAKSVPDVAKLDFVKVMELATPLYLKKK